MALSIKNPLADELVREITAETGESITDAVIVALQERRDRVRGRKESTIKRRLSALSEEVRTYPVVDERPAHEIIGYDEHGLPA